MDPIDILSSDSDSDIEVGPAGSDVPVIPRKLPNWASTSGSNSTSKGYGSPSLNYPMTAGISSIEGHTDQSDHAWVNNQWYQSPNGNETTSAVLMKNDPKLAASSKDASQQLNGLRSKDIVDSNPAKMSENDLGRFSSEQVPRRMLPSSLQPSSSISKGKTSLENGSVGQISNTHDKPYNYVGTTITDQKSYAKDRLGRENSEVLMYGHNGGRLLPPSLVHGKSVANLQSVGSSDPVHRSGLEDRPAENDERLIFQAALENLAQPKLEATLPDGLLEVSLLRHQKIALAWMFQKETKSLHCLGGILADDQGLGKTISMIALILLQSHLKLKSVRDDLQTTKAEAWNLDDDDEDISEFSKGKQDGESDEVKKIPKVTTSMPTFHKGRPAAGTLVVCPASVLRQWARELDEKVTANAKLSVLIYHGGARTKDPVELAKYDVVLTTYSIVTNEVPKQPLVDEDDEEDPTNGEGFGLSSEFSVNKKRKKASNASKKGKKGKKRSNNSSFDCDSGPLARVGWFRVVLDEAQTIKNHRTQVARACCGLRAKRRWCLSGTPIQNTIDDLYSYFRFLKYDPYAVFKSFCSSIKYPISRNTINGYKKLQAVLKTIMLRRTKETLIDGEPIVNLPPKSTYLKKVEFSSEERAFYSKLEAESRLQFKAYAAAGTVRQNYANILLMLLRLRQACDHPLLVKGYNYDSAGRASLQMARGLPRDMLINLVNLLEASLAICGVCNDPPEDAVVTMCGHVFCYQCVSDYLTGDDNICPAPECKELLGEDIVFSKATLRSCLSGEFDGNGASSSEIAESSLALQNVFGSCKIKAALEILEKYCKLSERPNIEGCSDISFSSEPTNSQRVDFNVSTDTTRPGGPIKALIFSQWTGMLDLVETSLNYSCIQYRRFDGTMSLASRDRAVKDFNNDPEVTVMLMSLKAGNLGLNLVAACHVILLDLWWNPTTEDQAIDRAHRIGQTRPVTVSRITVKDTVEDRILALQEEKRKMVASAFGEDQKGGSAARLTVEDLRYLFMV